MPPGPYLPAQVAGCVTGAVAANLMFAEAAVSVSARHRASGAHALSEVIATAGLVLVIFALARSRRLASAPAAVGAYIGCPSAKYWFTAFTAHPNTLSTVRRRDPPPRIALPNRTCTDPRFPNAGAAGLGCQSPASSITASRRRSPHA